MYTFLFIHFDKDVHQTYSEVSIDKHFPEFADVPDIVLAMSLKYIEEETSRISAIGCESGELQVARTALRGNEIELVSSWKVDLDSPISVVQFFNDKTPWPIPEALRSVGITEREDVPAPQTALLVGNMLGTSFVYRDVLGKGQNAYAMLPASDQFDTVVCGCVADIDMDGENEVILGTYGQEVLVYKLERVPVGKDEYSLLWQQTVSHPILSLRYMDLIGDGVCELLVLSTKGLHILQHDLQEMTQLCLERIRKVAALVQEKSAGMAKPHIYC